MLGVTLIPLVPTGRDDRQRRRVALRFEKVCRAAPSAVVGEPDVAPDVEPAAVFEEPLEPGETQQENARDKLGELANRDPTTLRPSDIQGWIAANKTLEPKTVRHYLSTLRQVLDFAEVEPNPARSPKVKVPPLVRDELSPPSRVEWDALLGKLAPRVVLAVRLMECCGLRLGETRQLMFGDVDFADGRIRISRARTKGGTAGQRWLPVPDELLDEIDALVPLEDRHADHRCSHSRTGRFATRSRAPASSRRSPTIIRTICATAASRSGSRTASTR